MGLFVNIVDKNSFFVIDLDSDFLPAPIAGDKLNMYVMWGLYRIFFQTVPVPMIYVIFDFLTVTYGAF